MGIGENNRARVLRNQLSKLCYEELDLLTVKQNGAFKSQKEKLKDTLQGYIPESMERMFCDAFTGAFGGVLKKGKGMIEKTYSKDAKAEKLSTAAQQLDRVPTRKSFDQIEKNSKAAIRTNKLLSAAEGGVLGVLGVGLPDIPVFVGMMLRTVYEVALSYGFDYDTPEEQGYVLSLISLSFCEGDRTEEYSRLCDRIAADIAKGQGISPQEHKERIAEAAAMLSAYMTLAKAVQGLPIIGVVGGVTNYQMISRLGKVANIKYKKRYLERELMDL